MVRNGYFCYNILMSLKKIPIAGALLSWAVAIPALAADQVRGSVKLIQPLDDSTGTLAASNDIFLNYFNLSVDWIFLVATGFATMWVLIGGVMYMVSGNDQGLRGKAISKITSAVLGLIILLFAGVILRTLNSLFYV